MVKDADVKRELYAFLKSKGFKKLGTANGYWDREIFELTNERIFSWQYFHSDLRSYLTRKFKDSEVRYNYDVDSADYIVDDIGIIVATGTISEKEPEYRGDRDWVNHHFVVVDAYERDEPYAYEDDYY